MKNSELLAKLIYLLLVLIIRLAVGYIKLNVWLMVTGVKIVYTLVWKVPKRFLFGA